MSHKTRFTNVARKMIPLFCILGLIFNINNVYATCSGLTCVCLVSSSLLNFGSYNSVSNTPAATTGNIAVTCSVVLGSMNVSYQIALNAGLNGSFASRKMVFLSSTLLYNLYSNSTYTTVWGDGTANTGVVSDSYSSDSLLVIKNYPIYGLIPASQNVTPGLYADVITVTVTY